MQGLLIVSALVPSLVNWLYAGPKATEVMFERHRLEKLEGKSYDDAQVCPFPPMGTKKRSCGGVKGQLEG